MFYKNDFSTSKTLTKKFNFDNFVVTYNKDESLMSGSEIYNFSNEKGNLENNYGIKKFSVKNGNNDYEIDPVTTEIKGVWSAKWVYNANANAQDYIFYMLDDNKIYYRELSHPATVMTIGHTFSQIPTLTKVFENNGEAFIFTSTEDSMILINQNSITTYQNAPKVIDTCYHYSKLFAITSDMKNSLVYSSDTEVKNWTSENIEKISFNDERGRLLKLKIFDDAIYIFREYGISKVYESSGNIVVEHIFMSDDYIFPETICENMNKIIFLSTSGLNSFNGTSVKSLKYNEIKNIVKNLDSQPVAESFEGKYFLACQYPFITSGIGCENSIFTNNAVLIFDLVEEKVEFLRGIDVKKFIKFNSANLSKLAVILRGNDKSKIGELSENIGVFGNVNKQIWRSGKTDFGYIGKLKHIKEFYIKTAGCKVIIKSDIEEKEYTVLGSNDLQRIQTDVRGKEFVIIIQSEILNQKISNFELTVTIYQ